MIDVVFRRAIIEYFSNFKVMLSYGVLFLFLALFIWFNQFLISSGTVLLSFNPDLIGIIGLVVIVVFLYIFSFFVSLTVYSVHRDVQNVNFDTYWNELFKDAALKIFFLYLILGIIFYVIGALGLMFGFIFWGLIINLVISLAVMFAPQSIVLDRASVFEAIVNSLEFWASNFLIALLIFIVASLLLFVAVFIEFYLQGAGYIGAIISFFLVLVVLVPFIEQTKSYAYLLKVDLLKSNEFVHVRAPRFERPKIKHGVRLRERPRHGSKL